NHLDVLAGRRLAGLLASGRYDIVHFHTARAHAMTAFIGRPQARRIVTRRMDYQLRGGAYARWLYNRRADAVVAISAGVRSALVASGVRPERITVVPSGVDVERFAVAAREREAARARLRSPPAPTRSASPIGCASSATWRTCRRFSRRSMPSRCRRDTRGSASP